MAKQTKTAGKKLKAAKRSQTPAKAKVAKAPKVARITTYQGAPIPATRAYSRTMPEFRNCQAESIILINDEAGTNTFANTYNGQLKASYDPIHYTYPMNPKKIEKKISDQGYRELEITEWPTWIINAKGVRSIKTPSGKRIPTKAMKRKASEGSGPVAWTIVK